MILNNKVFKIIINNGRKIIKALSDAGYNGYSLSNVNSINKLASDLLKIMSFQNLLMKLFKFMNLLF